MTSPEQLARWKGKRIFVAMHSRIGNPEENYSYEGVVTDTEYSVIPNSDLTATIWLTDGYYQDLDDPDKRVVFRPGHRECINMTDLEISQMIEVKDE